MSQPKVTFKYYLRFKKFGTAVWISHLDMVRTFQRIFMRAGISIVFSEGFNPHPKMVFAVPLPLGASSECELLEFRLEEERDPSYILQRLKSVCPVGIEIFSVELAERKFTDICYASYDLFFADDIIPSLGTVVEHFNSRAEAVVLKKTKSGEKEKDIKPSVGKIESTDFGIRAILSVDSENFLGPELFMTALNQSGEALGMARIAPISLNRTAMLLKNMKSEF
jgi:radical SAM-linked protein